MEEPRCQPKKRGDSLKRETMRFSHLKMDGWKRNCGSFWGFLGTWQVRSFSVSEVFIRKKKNGFQAREVSPSKRRSRFSRATRRRLSRLRSAPSGRKAAFFLPSLRKHGRKLAKLFNATNCPTPRTGPRPSWFPLKNYTLPDTNSKSPYS